MSVPTTFDAVSGNTSSITSPKKVPLPTDVSPTMKPPATPRKNAIRRSDVASTNGASLFARPVRNVFTAKPMPPAISATPRTIAAASSKPSP